MFISVLDLFKIGIGPSSSHTMGPMLAAHHFRQRVVDFLREVREDEGREQHNNKLAEQQLHLRCILKGSLAYTGKGHATDRAVVLGLHGHRPGNLAGQDVDALFTALTQEQHISLSGCAIAFCAETDIVFDRGEPLTEHPNGMMLELWENNNPQRLLSETYFSIGGGFVLTRDELLGGCTKVALQHHPYPFDSALSMLNMSRDSGKSIAEMKRANEYADREAAQVDEALDSIWRAMQSCVDSGLGASGVLPGGLNVARRARELHRQIMELPEDATINDWLCAYAMAVNEENAAGQMVVTAPTNGAAGVVPAVLYYLVHHHTIERRKVHDFLLVAGAIGGLIKHRSSISGAEVGCQGEVGSAAAMAAAGMCAALAGSPAQIENAAEIALEHHLGMTCDPVGGLVQVPCIERNGFGAIKAYTAAKLALRGTGHHFMPLDNCIAAMKQTGLEMSEKYKETSMGGLAVNFIEC